MAMKKGFVLAVILMLLNFDAAFAQWDAARQFAPYRANLATDHAVVVAQDGVCGKGRGRRNGRGGRA